MSNNCKGIFGEWFGHNFESYLVESIPAGEAKTGGMFPSDVIKLAEVMKHKKYSVICKRCGEIKEN